MMILEREDLKIYFIRFQLGEEFWKVSRIRRKKGKDNLSADFQENISHKVKHIEDFSLVTRKIAMCCAHACKFYIWLRNKR